MQFDDVSGQWKSDAVSFEPMGVGSPEERVVNEFDFFVRNANSFIKNSQNDLLITGRNMNCTYGFGWYAKLVPSSIIVGFTIGIAVATALTNLEDILGIKSFASLLGQEEDIRGGCLKTYGRLTIIWMAVFWFG